MDDLVTRLHDAKPPHHRKCLQAADEIERLRAIAEEIDAGHPVDAFDIRIEATRIATQAEMIERGLTDE